MCSRSPMPSTPSSGRDHQIWLKKHLNVWKTKSTNKSSSNIGSAHSSGKTEETHLMKMKAYEKIVSKALSKAKYRHVNKCKSEVLNVMKIYRGLSPKFEKFIFDNGEEKDLLNLVGTIPVDYKGHTYNIPIQLWFLYDFPVGSCPMGFVVPTKDMQLKVSNYVDHTGKIVLSYLNTWQYPSSNLIGMIQACREGFGCLPPVFAKTSNVNHTNSNTSSHNTALLNGAAVEDMEGQQDLDEDHERISLLNQVENVMKERFLEEFHKTKAELQTLHSTNKDLLDGQEDIGAIEADFTAKLSQVDACLADLNLRKIIW